MLNIIACQKVFFITSERVVSCADHYHVSVHATVTGMHFYEMCMDFIRSMPLCFCVRVYAVYSGWPGGIGGETAAFVFPWTVAYCWLFTWKSSRWIGHWPRRPAHWNHAQLAPGLSMPSFLWAPFTVPWQGQIASTAPSTKTFWGLRFQMVTLVLW